MRILVITEDYFPYGTAMASRLLAFCDLFDYLGYKVHVIALHSNDLQAEKKIKHYKNDITYEIITNDPKTSKETFLGNKELVERTENHLQNNDVDIVFAASVHIHYRSFLGLCKKYRKPLVLEQCEWYDVSSYKLGKLDPRFVRFTDNILNHYGKADAVIAISRYLFDYYSNKTKTIRIPSITDVQNRKCSLKVSNEKIKIVFTGSAGKSKEDLNAIVKALVSEKEFLDRIEFDVYGLSKKELLRHVDEYDLEKAGDSIKAFGFIPQQEIEKVLLEADYEIFIRPLRRSSDAGFPTKLCESLTAGTPVISNCTGDIPLFIKDGENGFLCQGNDVSEVIKVFRRLIYLSPDEYERMRKNARKTAEDSFDYRNYTKPVSDLFDELLENNSLEKKE